MSITDKIKTINNQSLIGIGNIDLSSGTEDTQWRNSTLSSSIDNNIYSIIFDRGNDTSTIPITLETKSINNESIIGNGNIEIKSSEDDISWKNSQLDININGNNNELVDISLNRGNNTNTNIKTLSTKLINNETILGEGNINIKDDTDWKNSLLNISTTNNKVSINLDRGNSTNTDPISFNTKTINGESILGLNNITIEDNTDWKESIINSSLIDNTLSYSFNRGNNSGTTTTDNIYFNTINGKSLINTTATTDIIIKEYTPEFSNNCYKGSLINPLNIYNENNTIIATITKQSDTIINFQSIYNWDGIATLIITAGNNIPYQYSGIPNTPINLLKPGTTQATDLINATFTLYLNSNNNECRSLFISYLDKDICSIKTDYPSKIKNI